MSKITATGSRRILQERSGKVTGSCRKAREIAGSGSGIPTGNLLGFFRWIPANFLCFPAGTSRKSSEKIRKFSGGNTASTFQRFPVLSCRNRPVIFDLGGDIICRLIVLLFVLVRCLSFFIFCNKSITFARKIKWFFTFNFKFLFLCLNLSCHIIITSWTYIYFFLIIFIISEIQNKLLFMKIK